MTKSWYKMVGSLSGDPRNFSAFLLQIIIWTLNFIWILFKFLFLFETLFQVLSSVFLQRIIKKQQFFTFIFSFRKTYILVENIFAKTQFISLHFYYTFFMTFLLHFFALQVIWNVKLKHYHIWRFIFIGLVDAILRLLILGNKLGIST